MLQFLQVVMTQLSWTKKKAKKTNLAIPVSNYAKKREKNDEFWDNLYYIFSYTFP